jgi:propanediol utilization protein
MTPEDAQRLGVGDGQIVSIEIDGPRGGTYSHVAVRANGASALECHVDTEEANAMSMNSLSKIKILK